MKKSPPIIISASRRTDIPAFYSKWFMNRIREGRCTVPNPFNLKQVSEVSLKPEDVSVIVFWTRNPRPLFPYLNELDEKGYRYYFQFTLMDNPHQIDPNAPRRKTSIRTFKELAEKIGPEKVIWRYDPIVITEITPVSFHEETFIRIARALNGFTRRAVISIVDDYPKIRKRMINMGRVGAALISPMQVSRIHFDNMMQSMVAVARDCDMEITSCAEEFELKRFGIQMGKCIDDQLIGRLFGQDVSHKKDPSQRKACGCVASKDIGMYDTCLFGCQYCYATSSFNRAKINHADHNQDSPSLIGWDEVQPATDLNDSEKKDQSENQLTLL